MDIRGLQKLSMVDFPGKLAATVFTGGCNLRCPFCHNALLVTRLAETPRLEAGEVLAFLSRRVGMLDGVVLRIGLSWLFGIVFGWGFFGFVLGYGLAPYGYAIPSLIYFLSGIWKKRRVLAERL